MLTETQELLHIVDMLPKTEQIFIYETIKRVILAWDPDYTKLTPEEAEQLERSKKELECGEVYSMDDIDWE